MRLRCAIDGFAATGCRNLNLKFLKIRFRFNLAILAHMHTHQYTHPQLCLRPSAKYNKRAVQTATACGSWGYPDSTVDMDGKVVFRVVPPAHY